MKLQRRVQQQKMCKKDETSVLDHYANERNLKGRFFIEIIILEGLYEACVKDYISLTRVIMTGMVELC